jgi:hypothetical protein
MIPLTTYFHDVHFTIMSDELRYEQNSNHNNFVRNDLARAASDPRP